MNQIFRSRLIECRDYISEINRNEITSNYRNTNIVNSALKNSKDDIFKIISTYQNL